MNVDIIYNIDCIAGMKEHIPDNSIDLIVTSPPYNLGIEYDLCNDRLPLEEYWSWCKEWITECFRVLKPDGRLCLNHYLSCGTSEERFAPLMKLNCIAEDVGFKHHGIAIWNDRTITKRTAWGSWISARACYINSPFEGILIMFKERWRKDNAGISTITPKEFMEDCSGIWNITPEKDRSGCPAPFPVQLPSRCIRLLSYEGDIVLDPFLGGGTTAVAAKQSMRHYIGFEISKAYYDNAVLRLSQDRMSDWLE